MLKKNILMKSIAIIYGSSTGNTAYVAGEIEKKLAAQGMDVKTVEAGRAKPEGLCDGFDMVLLVLVLVLKKFWF